MQLSHRYPWSLEERAILAVLLLGPGVLTAWRAFDGGVGVQLPLVLHALSLALAVGLFQLGRRRKDGSRITGTLTGTVLSATGGRVGATRGDLALARSVSVTHLGPETVLQVELARGTLQVSCRLGPQLAPVLREQLLREDVRMSPAAEALLASWRTRRSG